MSTDHFSTFGVQLISISKAVTTTNMFKRQPLAAVSSATRPRCLVSARCQSTTRYYSDLNWADRQRGQEKGSNTMRTLFPSLLPIHHANTQTHTTATNPAPEHAPTPHNQPANALSRQQRAAQVSEEVRMLNRGSTAATVSGGNNSIYPTEQSKTVDPEAVGAGGSGVQMGANDAVGRESAFVQSPGHQLRAGEEDSPTDAVSNETVISNGEQELDANEEDEDEDEDMLDADTEMPRDPMGESTANELIILEQFDKQDITAVPFSPEPVTRDEYLKLGQGGATIAAGNFAGVLEDRIKIVAEADQDDFRYAPDIAKRMLNGDLVSFKDEQEKAEVLAAVNKEDFAFSPIPANSQTVMFDKLVRGAYPDPSATPHKNKILNEVSRTIARNSTYLNKDSTKLLRKIGSLLPSEAAARKSAAAPKQ
jgi:hypothetical protein